VCIRYRGNFSTEPLPSNDKGCFTEPLWLETIGEDTQTHRQQRDLISLLYFFKIGIRLKNNLSFDEVLSAYYTEAISPWAVRSNTGVGLGVVRAARSSRAVVAAALRERWWEGYAAHTRSIMLRKKSLPIHDQVNQHHTRSIMLHNTQCCAT
jgi:hypothetical protein